jgi:hypothetical protein
VWCTKCPLVSKVDDYRMCSGIKEGVFKNSHAGSMPLLKVRALCEEFTALLPRFRTITSFKKFC